MLENAFLQKYILLWGYKNTNSRNSMVVVNQTRSQEYEVFMNKKCHCTCKK